jgi:YEATS domain-containing protein 4
MASAPATVPPARATSGVPAPTESSSRTNSVPDLGSAIGSAVDQAPPRLVNTTACLPIAYGSVAFFLGKKADEYHTHRWTLFLRGPNNEDLSVCIAKVVFQLHPSFAQPVRELTTSPFEVTEQGWGEFEAQIRIVWKDPTEKSTLVCSTIDWHAGRFLLLY